MTHLGYNKYFSKVNIVSVCVINSDANQKIVTRCYRVSLVPFTCITCGPDLQCDYVWREGIYRVHFDS